MVSNSGARGSLWWGWFGRKMAGDAWPHARGCDVWRRLSRLEFGHAREREKGRGLMEKGVGRERQPERCQRRARAAWSQLAAASARSSLFGRLGLRLGSAARTQGLGRQTCALECSARMRSQVAHGDPRGNARRQRSDRWSATAARGARRWSARRRHCRARFRPWSGQAHAA